MWKGGKRQRSNGLSCRRSNVRQQRHADLNDIIWRSIKRAQIPVSKESTGLSRTNGKRPDEATFISWSQGKSLAWDVTVPDTFANSHLKDTSVIAGAAANRATDLKCTNYTVITSTHTFAPIGIDTSGSWNENSIGGIVTRRQFSTLKIDLMLKIRYLASCH